MICSYKDLESWTIRLLGAAGLDASDAAGVTDIFMRATLRGIGHHDHTFLPGRLKWMRDHGVNPRPKLSCFNQGPSYENWDADHALGELACRHAALRAMDIARRSGMGFATVRRSNHFLAAAPYVELGVESGFMIIVWSNTDAGMSSPDGTRNYIGNNPMGFGVGVEGRAPVNFDSCVAYSSLGNLKALHEAGQAVPAWWGVDGKGQSTTEPGAILQGGSVHPLGGHKGFGMAIMHECLTGLLGQGTTFDEVIPVGGVNTHNQAVLAFSLDAFGGRAFQESRTRDMVDRMKAAEPGIRIPGERSHATGEAMLRDGLVIPDATWRSLEQWSMELGVEVPAT